MKSCHEGCLWPSLKRLPRDTLTHSVVACMSGMDPSRGRYWPWPSFSWRVGSRDQGAAQAIKEAATSQIGQAKVPGMPPQNLPTLRSISKQVILNGIVYAHTQHLGGFPCPTIIPVAHQSPSPEV